MNTDNVVLMKMARESLNGKWGLAIGTCFLYSVIIGAIEMIPEAGPILSLIIIGPLALGITIFSLAISRNENARIEQLFQGFHYFGVALGTYLLMLLFIILWFFLLIIPGIIAGISYSMAFFILADDDSVGPMEAIDRSKEMMYGYKWKYFYLMLRFLGWAFLCILTLGIGFLWLMPYVQVTTAKFYEDIKDNVLDEEMV